MACISKRRTSAVKNLDKVTINESTRVPNLGDNYFEVIYVVRIYSYLLTIGFGVLGRPLVGQVLDLETVKTLTLTRVLDSITDDFLQYNFTILCRYIC